MIIRQLTCSKKFWRYLVKQCYPVAIDGTQKWASQGMRSEQCLERMVRKGGKDQTHYYAYVLKASLAFQNGMTIPLLSEFLRRADGDTGTDKQDCEQKAFHRMV